GILAKLGLTKRRMVTVSTGGPGRTLASRTGAARSIRTTRTCTRSHARMPEKPFPALLADKEPCEQVLGSICASKRHGSQGSPARPRTAASQRALGETRGGTARGRRSLLRTPD